MKGKSFPPQKHQQSGQEEQPEVLYPTSKTLENIT